MEAFRHIYEENGFTLEMITDKAVRELIDEYASAFSGAIAPSVQSGVIPSVMAQHLKEDVFVFSGFKTYQELREAAALLVDEKGLVKSFNRFYRDITAIKEDYNRHWLKAEYIFARASAEMAAKWKDFEADGEAIYLDDRGRRALLTSWQKRKNEVILHPFLKEKIPIGLIPYAQAMLFARVLRGDLDRYPPFVWR